MKKFILAVISTILICPIMLMAATNNLYTVTLSTNPSTTAPTATGVLTPHINLASVKVKRITVTNTGGNAQTITFYQNATSTTTYAPVYVYQVPAAYQTYEVIAPISNVFLNADLVDIPYIGVKSSTSTTPCTLNVEYWN